MKKYAVFCVLVLSSLFLIVIPAQAHRIFITAWVEENQMCTESLFSATSRVKDSEVTVSDSFGTVLFQGKTDSEGKACFPLPPSPMKLTFTVNAGQGHHAETELLPESFKDVLSVQSSVSAALPGVNTDVLAAVVASELQKQLGPIRQSLQALQYSKPGLVEILGGIGWIIGLAGVGMMIACRRKKD